MACRLSDAFGGASLIAELSVLLRRLSGTPEGFSPWLLQTLVYCPHVGISRARARAQVRLIHRVVVVAQEQVRDAPSATEHSSVFLFFSHLSEKHKRSIGDAHELAKNTWKTTKSYSMRCFF
jgi:hypothetical protein